MFNENTMRNSTLIQDCENTNKTYLCAMDGYVNSDGVINLGPKCLGIVKFKDGHFEPIICIDVITKSHFIFSTTSGRYVYKEEQIDEPLSYFDDNKYMHITIQHNFAKSKLECSGGPSWIEDWELIDTIEQVFVNTNLCPSLYP